MMTTHEVTDRAAVARLLLVLSECGVTADEMRGADETAWAQVAHDAKVPTPGPETRRLVIERMGRLAMRSSQ